ncbi:MAG: MFS transporter [Hyphomonadaceae bacterium]|nr:MFS transporter [Hyphomonadaceae bacterium]
MAYGVGAAAFGIKDTGFSYVLLMFYSQVIGLDAPLVGLALTTALVLDAILDPIVGYWSDNFRSRWGRRHLFMYASAIPIAISYFLMWNPPSGWDQAALFWYILVLAILTRTFLAFFETPSAALAPELSRDYDERSTLLSYRSFFGWTGGNAMTVLAFFILFPSFATTSDPTSGQFNPQAYAVYGGIAAALILASILISSLGTHGYIARLSQPPPRERLKLSDVFREMFETLANRSFLSIFVAALFANVAVGLGSALSVYFSTYFWGFTPIQIGFITLAIFVSALIGASLAPVLTRTLGKKRGAIVIGLAGLAISPAAILLRLLGIIEGGGDDLTFWVVMIQGQIYVVTVVCFQVLMASMIADLVEQSELKTGRRSEGVFFAANTFIQKMTTGVGVMAATLVLALANFPAGADPSQVSNDVLQSLGWNYLPAMLLLHLATVGSLLTYSLSRQAHEENLRKLEQTSASS